VFNPEKVKITLQKMGDQILYLTVVLENYVTCTHIGSSSVCSYLRICGEKSAMNELIALSLLISSMKDMDKYNMGSPYLLNAKNDMRFSNESDRMTTFLLTVILHKHDEDDF